MKKKIFFIWHANLIAISKFHSTRFSRVFLRKLIKIKHNNCRKKKKKCLNVIASWKEKASNENSVFIFFFFSILLFIFAWNKNAGILQVKFLVSIVRPREKKNADNVWDLGYLLIVCNCFYLCSFGSTRWGKEKKKKNKVKKKILRVWASADYWGVEREVMQMIVWHANDLPSSSQSVYTILVFAQNYHRRIAAFMNTLDQSGVAFFSFFLCYTELTNVFAYISSNDLYIHTRKFLPYIFLKNSRYIEISPQFPLARSTV